MALGSLSLLVPVSSCLSLKRMGPVYRRATRMYLRHPSIALFPPDFWASCTLKPTSSRLDLNKDLHHGSIVLTFLRQPILKSKSKNFDYVAVEWVLHATKDCPSYHARRWIVRLRRVPGCHREPHCLPHVKDEKYTCEWRSSRSMSRIRSISSASAPQTLLQAMNLSFAVF